MLRARLISFALTLLMLVTSQTMGMAQGASQATGQMVICTGEGTQVVYTDADGAPTSAPHHCPDCILLLATNVGGHVLAFWSAAELQQSASTFASSLTDALRVPHPPVRGPPYSV